VLKIMLDVFQVDRASWRRDQEPQPEFSVIAVDGDQSGRLVRQGNRREVPDIGRWSGRTPSPSLRT